jgi:hypothetical protein
VKDDDVIQHYLWLHDFADIGDWALTQGYRHEKRTDTWYDDEGKPVDLEQRLDRTITDEAHAHLDSLY